MLFPFILLIIHAFSYLYKRWVLRWVVIVNGLRFCLDIMSKAIY